MAECLISGACSCHAYQWRLTLPGPPPAPRACSCQFCQNHSALWLSHPEAKLVLQGDSTALSTQTQGDELARFHFCPHCADLLYAAWEQDGTHVSLNVQRTEQPLPEAVAVNPGQLSATDKKARWMQLWIKAPRWVDAHSGSD